MTPHEIETVRTFWVDNDAYADLASDRNSEALYYYAKAEICRLITHIEATINEDSEYRSGYLDAVEDVKSGKLDIRYESKFNPPV